jgi:hypothetical protein
LNATAHMYCSTAQRTNKFVIPAQAGIQVAFEKVKMDPR